MNLMTITILLLIAAAVMVTQAAGGEVVWFQDIPYPAEVYAALPRGVIVLE